MNNLNRKQKLLSILTLAFVLSTTGFLAVGTPFFMIRYSKIVAAKTKGDTYKPAASFKNNARGKNL